MLLHQTFGLLNQYIFNTMSLLLNMTAESNHWQKGISLYSKAKRNHLSRRINLNKILIHLIYLTTFIRDF